MKKLFTNPVPELNIEQVPTGLDLSRVSFAVKTVRFWKGIDLPYRYALVGVGVVHLGLFMAWLYCKGAGIGQ